MGWRSTLVAGVILLVAMPLRAEEPAEQWVQKMVTASRQASFQGHSVLLSGGKVTSLAIYHAPVENEVWERVVHLSGEPAEILRKGSSISCFHPGVSSRLEVGRSPLGKLSALEESAQSVSRYYRFKRAGLDRVAGRDGVRIDVEPLDSHRFGYSLWLDETSGVLLKSQTNPAEGDPLEVFEFVSVDIGNPVPLSAFEPDARLLESAIELAPPPAVAETVADTGWETRWLPEGFRQAGRATSRPDKPERSARVFTDGLAAFTVFFEPGRPAVRETTRAHGATVAVNRSLADGKAMVTVVGEIPLATASRIAENVVVLEGRP